jgi:hypothetical protein
MKNWYTKLEVHGGTKYWKKLTRNIKVTFNFKNNDPLIDSSLEVIKNNIFASEDSIGSIPLYGVPRCFCDS